MQKAILGFFLFFLASQFTYAQDDATEKEIHRTFQNEMVKII